MLLFKEPIPASWLEKIRSTIPDILVDHAHLERKAATGALTMQKYKELIPYLDELTEIVIEEMEHFRLLLELLRKRDIPFGPPRQSPWIHGMMSAIRRGRRTQAVDHLTCCALIEGRSCEKFQILAEGLKDLDPELAEFYGSLVESEGNHYASYLIMARHIDEEDARERLEYFLNVDAELMRVPHTEPVLH